MWNHWEKVLAEKKVPKAHRRSYLVTQRGLGISANYPIWRMLIRNAGVYSEGHSYPSLCVGIFFGCYKISLLQIPPQKYLIFVWPLISHANLIFTDELGVIWWGWYFSLSFRKTKQHCKRCEGRCLSLQHLLGRRSLLTSPQARLSLGRGWQLPDGGGFALLCSMTQELSSRNSCILILK